ncbi:MAG: ATP synthase subunit I [Leptolyngbyaceae cyanobacterium]
MNSPDNHLKPASSGSETDQVSGATDSDPNLPPEPSPSMVEYYQLQQELWLTSIILIGIIFPTVWFTYSLNVALNYIVGASIGVVYIRLLGKKVEGIGRQKSMISNVRFALIIGVLVIATRLQELEILPIFLGFLTYKVAIIIYMLRSILLPESK